MPQIAAFARPFVALAMGNGMMDIGRSKNIWRPMPDGSVKMESHDSIIEKHESKAYKTDSKKLTIIARGVLHKFNLIDL
jgi:hypothetical protein